VIRIQWRVQGVSQIAEITSVTKKTRRAVVRGQRIRGVLWKAKVIKNYCSYSPALLMTEVIPP
jgi:hypothetical protein